jgi:SAM-dependent methyltransferase
MTSSDVWDEDTAERYDDETADLATAAVLGPIVDTLAGLAGPGPVLELAVGTGRVAIPLSRRGITVHGVDLSEPMLDRLRAATEPGEIPVTAGDMATIGLERRDFSLVYLVFNSLGNLRTQPEQVECFGNAARHLSPGGRFVIELWVPDLRRFPPGAPAIPFDLTERHLGLDTLDPVTQQGTSHHYTRRPDGTYRYDVSNFRYVWPPECDLMARLAGLEFESRHADWVGTPFNADSRSHVSVWRKPGG